MTGRELPTGTLTFLFSDVEGSTRLAEIDPSAYPALLDRHRALLREAFRQHDGTEVGTEGDSFFVVFPRASDAAGAAADAQRALAVEPWPPDRAVRVRIGLHTGEAIRHDGSYMGHDVNRAARIAAAGHGGQILVSEATAPLVAGSLPAGTSLRALGYHRLKDLRPEHLCQLDVEGLPADFPPIRSLDDRRNNLPTQLTSFVGREREVRAAAELLEAARFVTLTGPGGTGKTRLSLQVAAEIADRFPDGVVWVPLADIDDPALVASQVAMALGLQDAGSRSPRDRLVEYLRDREVLLVIDNVERVAEAAPLLADLLREAPRLRILCSSRIVLRVSGEHDFPVPPLGLPEAGSLRGSEAAVAASGSEAVRLFVERAAAARPGFTLDEGNAAAITAIVARLDGLPLAIELAAARTRLLPPQAMVGRLERRLDLLTSGGRDLPPRQRTLRGAIAWSHELLDDPMRRLFARFSVFVGGAGLEEAESVCGPPDATGGEILDGLQTLVEHSLVRQLETDGEPRFAMLATIQEFAAEQLAAGGEGEALRERHAATYLALVEDAAPHLLGPDNAVWLNRIGREHDNIRAAMSWATERGDGDVALRYLAAMWRFWQIRGHLAEGRARAERALRLATAELLPSLRAAAHEAAGGLVYWVGDFVGAVPHYEAQLAAHREEGNRAGVAQALYNVAFPLLFANVDISRAWEAGREAETTFRELGDDAGTARALWLLANLANTEGDTAAARSYVEEAIPILRAERETFMLGWALFTLAQSATLDGRDDEAHGLVFEALDQFEAAGDVSGIVLVLDALAVLAHRAGDLERAARISGAVERLETTSGTGLNVTNRQTFEFEPAAMKDDPATAAAWQAGATSSTEAILAFVRAARPATATSG